jgi:hypothetical protein
MGDYYVKFHERFRGVTPLYLHDFIKVFLAKMKKILRIALIVLVFIIPTKGLLSQDSIKFFIGYDLVKGIINEQSLTFGYYLTQHHTITLSLGYTHGNKPLREQHYGLSPSQDKYPFLVYKGPTIRTSYEYRFASFFYVGADLFYKHLKYSNHTFIDSEGDPGHVTFTRDEKSNLFGFHINSGFMFMIPKIHFFINPAIGIGGTLKYRNYTTTDSETFGDVSFNIPNSTYTKDMQYLSVHVNLNIGITF